MKTSYKKGRILAIDHELVKMKKSTAFFIVMDKVDKWYDKWGKTVARVRVEQYSIMSRYFEHKENKDNHGDKFLEIVVIKNDTTGKMEYKPLPGANTAECEYLMRDFMDQDCMVKYKWPENLSQAHTPLTKLN